MAPPFFFSFAVLGSSNGAFLLLPPKPPPPLLFGDGLLDIIIYIGSSNWYIRQNKEVIKSRLKERRRRGSLRETKNVQHPVSSTPTAVALSKNNVRSGLKF